ncbi:MAG: hypothetical protein HQL30_11945, partial [Candidatus Omnitrophica bacterium]|nr:hypothetical protein [Candidatus Omnitrophota bacterium]
SVSENEIVNITGEKGNRVPARVVEISEVMTKLEPSGIGIDGISVGNAISKTANADVTGKEPIKPEVTVPMAGGHMSMDEENRLLRAELEKKNREISEMRSLIGKLKDSFQTAEKDIAKKESKK